MTNNSESLPLQLPVETAAQVQLPTASLLTPEQAAEQPSAAEELGLVDGEFQVWRNPAHGEAEGHFETGWTVNDTLNQRQEDGSLRPFVIVQKKVIAQDGEGTISYEKVFDHATFMSWQQPETANDAPSENTMAMDMALALAVPNAEELAVESSADMQETGQHEIELAEDLGETALEDAGAQLVELAEPIEAEVAAEVPPTDEAGSEAAAEDVPVDLRAIFADGASLEAAIDDTTLQPEVRMQLTQLGESWKATFGVSKAIEQAWGEDLQPALRAVLNEVPDSTSSLHRLVQESEDLATALRQLGDAHTYRDTETAQRTLRQMNLDVAIPNLRSAAHRLASPDDVIPSGRRLRTQNEVAFERVNHAVHDRLMTPQDYQDLANYVQPLLATGAGLPEIDSEMQAATAGSKQSWNTAQETVQEAAMMFMTLPLEDAGRLLSGMASSLEELQYRSDLEYVWDIKQKALRLTESLGDVRARLYRFQVTAENAKMPGN